MISVERNLIWVTTIFSVYYLHVALVRLDSYSNARYGIAFAARRFIDVFTSHIPFPPFALRLVYHQHPNNVQDAVE